MITRSSCAPYARKSKRSRSYLPRAEWMEPRTLLSAISWTGGAGDNNWDTPGNWSTRSVPGSGDDVTINIAANVAHSSNAADSINSLNSTEPLTISGGTLSIAAASTINSTLSITGGMLAGAGDVSVSGLVTLTAGKLAGASALNANGGLLINSAGNSAGGYFFIDGRTINNPVGQTATWTGSVSNIAASDGSVFNNMGTFLAEGDGTFSDGGIGASCSFENSGHFIKSVSFDDVQMNVPFNLPGGSVDIQSGALQLYQGGASSAAAFNIEADGVLEFSDVYSLDANTTIAGTGTLKQSGYTTLVMPGNYAFTGTTSILEGTLQMDGSLTGSDVQIGSGTLSGTGTVAAIIGGAGGVSPGDGSQPGILNAHGDVELPDEGGFNVVLNNVFAGTGYSQLNVSGSVNLEDTELQASLGFTPESGDKFTIIKSTSPIVGTFSGLDEGALFTIGNKLFTITYHGGTGNDVVLNETRTVELVAPTVNEVIPSTGYESGGTIVTILGQHFTGATEVDFGTTPATGLEVFEDGRLTVNSPPGVGVVDVTVITPGGVSSRSALDLFTYTPTPPTQVTALSPNMGPAGGGTLVTISGLGFTDATAVKFGDTPTADFTVVNDTTITATSPPGINAVDVTVVTPQGTSPTSVHDQFVYGPTVTGISPNSGPAAGGTSVTITGTGFSGLDGFHGVDGVAEVDFGTTPALGSIEITDTTVTINSPPGTGVVDVTVRTAYGTSGVSPADRFTYIPDAEARPTVTSVTPNTGPESGGTSVTIVGTGFDFNGVTTVMFGDKPATNVYVTYKDRILAQSPPGAGVVDVTVTTAAGTSAKSESDRFTYHAQAPSISGVSPASGPPTGGTLVTINGTGFTGATKVDFGTTPAAEFTVVSDTTITAHSPVGANTVDVSVTTSAGTSEPSSADHFSYTVTTSPAVITPPSEVSPLPQLNVPKIESVVRLGFHMQPTSIVLIFSTALDAARAEELNNYQIVTLGGHGRNSSLVGHVTRVAAAVYDPARLTVTLYTAGRLDIHNRYRLTVNGKTASGIRGATGEPLLVKTEGKLATNYVATITGKLLAGPAPLIPASVRLQLAERHRAVGPLTLSNTGTRSAQNNLIARPAAAHRFHGNRHLPG